MIPTTPTEIKALVIDAGGEEPRPYGAMLGDGCGEAISFQYRDRINGTSSYLKRHPADVLLLDLASHSQRGLIHLQDLRVNHRRLPLIALCPAGDGKLVEQAMENGADDCLIKEQINGELLARVIRYSIERKKTEDAWKKSEETYLTILRNLREGVYHATIGGQFLSANPSFAHMLGYESPEALMESVSDVGRQVYVNPAQRLALTAAVQRDGAVHRFETEFVRKDGSRIWVCIYALGVSDGRGRITSFHGICEDITLRKSIDRERREGIERLRKALGCIVQAMAGTVEVRDPYTAGHQRRVADLARSIATAMNLSRDQIDGIRLASMIHDVGKICVPVEILSKPTMLANVEFMLIKTHVRAGYDILKDIDFPWPIARMILEHHERLDGSGYPKGLRGHEILPESWILGVADVVEAIASHRPYRPAHGIQMALGEISKNRSILYEPSVVDCCLHLFEGNGYRFDACQK